jgi:tetratricopeptide (TPR) repeat protein
MHFKKGDYSRALTELKRAESLMEPIAPEDAEILEHIAHAHRELGQHKQAIDYLERAAALKSPVQRMRDRIEQTLRQWKGAGDTKTK